MKLFVALWFGFLTSLCRASFPSFDFKEIPEFNFANMFPLAQPSSHDGRIIGTPCPKPAASLESPPVVPDHCHGLVGLAIPKEKRAKRDVNDTPKTPKKIRIHVAHSADESIEQIIEYEVSYSAFKIQERIDQIRRTLNLIATNDLDLFSEDQVNFKNIFGLNYKALKKGETVLLYRHLLLFSADKLFISFWNFQIKIDETYIPVFDYLLETKSVDHILMLLALDKSKKYTEEVKQYLQTALLARCPEHLVLKRAFIKLIGHSSKFFELGPLLGAPETQETFEKFANIVYSFELVPNSDDVLGALVKENMIYYTNACKEIKFRIIQTMLAKDDVEGMAKLLADDPDMVLHVQDCTKTFYFAHNTNIMREAVVHDAYKCLDYLLNRFPEMAHSSTGNIESPIIHMLLFKSNDLMYDLFDKHGFNAKFVFTINGKQLNILQAAFHKKSLKSFIYYSNKVGIETAKEMIRAIWTTDDAILESVSERFSANFINHITTIFGINPNSTI